MGISRVAGCLYRCHTALKSKAEKSIFGVPPFMETPMWLYVSVLSSIFNLLRWVTNQLLVACSPLNLQQIAILMGSKKHRNGHLFHGVFLKVGFNVVWEPRQWIRTPKENHLEIRKSPYTQMCKSGMVCSSKFKVPCVCCPLNSLG